MKCKTSSMGMVNIIAMICDDIITDKSPNDLKTCLEMIEIQVNNLRVIEDVKKEEIKIE